MPGISSDKARSQIADLVRDSVYAAIRLKEALEDERRALEAQDIDSLHAVVESKTACADKLRSLDAKRAALCEACGFATGPNQMTALIEWCDADDVIGRRWEELKVLAAEGSTLNMTNGAIIRVRQQQFESSLSILRGGEPGADTYCRNGEESGDYSRRPLAEA